VKKEREGQCGKYVSACEQSELRSMFYFMDTDVNIDSFKLPKHGCSW
jgi:hypothetical protein